MLGILYESLHPSDHDPLDAAVGQRRRGPRACECSTLKFTIIAAIGILLLIGIVKKNAIMMVDFALEAERQGSTRGGDRRRLACLRFRPIMMTTCAALFGALPLAFGTGEGSELRHPLGITIVGGLIVSQASDALYDAGCLHLSRSIREVAGAALEPLSTCATNRRARGRRAYSAARSGIGAALVALARALGLRAGRARISYVPPQSFPPQFKEIAGWKIATPRED